MPLGEQPSQHFPAETLGAPELLRLLQLASPALPIGAFAYSQGLETAVELGWITDETTASNFLLGVLDSGFARLDLPVLGRLHAALAQTDDASFERWSYFLLASRESAERRLEDRQLGRALARLLADQGAPGASRWQEHPAVSHAGMFALAAVHFGVPLGAVLYGHAFAWAEAQVGALSRLLPLGQLAAQRILSQMARAIPEAVTLARSLPDAALGATLPGLAIASALHETQYSRLFKS